MIGISTVTQDTSGSLIFQELRDSDLRKQSARVSRISTLDGGVVLSHYGYCDGDRTFDLKAPLTETEYDTLKAIFEGQTLIYMATDEGFFSGMIENLSRSGKDIKLIFLVKEKLST